MEQVGFEETHINNDFQKAFDFDLVVKTQIVPVQASLGQSTPGYRTPNNQSNKSSSTSPEHGFLLLRVLSSLHHSLREKAVSRETKERGKNIEGSE
jgi:hypothetical protein